MALSEESGNMIMPVSPMGAGGGFGGDWGSWIILFLIFGMFGNGWGGGFGGGNALGYDFPWLLNGQNAINANTNAGFDNLATQTALNGIQGSIAGISQQLNNNEIASLERSFNAQTAQTAGMNNIAMGLQNCCCENRANIADLKYTVATENCADRQVVSDGIRDILTATQAQTTAILNQLCADKIEQKNDTIAQLRSELLYARGQASQDVQTAAIQAGQRALANEVEQYVAPMPRPAYIVQNPNCCQSYCGCGA